MTIYDGGTVFSSMNVVYLFLVIVWLYFIEEPFPPSNSTTLENTLSSHFDLHSLSLFHFLGGHIAYAAKTGEKGVHSQHIL